jgi:hypothetical protein
VACVFFCGHAREIVAIWRVGALAIVARIAFPIIDYAYADLLAH